MAHQLSRGSTLLVGAAIGMIVATGVLFAAMSLFTLVSISNSGPTAGIVTGAFYTLLYLVPALGIGLLCGVVVSAIVVAIRTAR